MRINQINSPVFKGNLFLNTNKEKEFKLDTKKIYSVKERESNLTSIYTDRAIYTVNAPITKVLQSINIANKSSIDVALKDSTAIYDLY